MKLDDGRLGLIDYGQTRQISDRERMDFARIVVALNQKVTAGHSKHLDIQYQRNITHVAHTMRMAGFVTRNNTDDDVMFHYAQLIFDSDEESVRRGFSIPQVRTTIYE
jgi:aarF domain-containing kinase